MREELYGLDDVRMRLCFVPYQKGLSHYLALLRPQSIEFVQKYAMLVNMHKYLYELVLYALGDCGILVHKYFCMNMTVCMYTANFLAGL